MTMVFCRGCGKEIHETARSCPNCGFIQNVPVANRLEDSQWMSVTAFVLTVLTFVNWFNLPDWDKDVKVGLWMFSITTLALAITSMQQGRKGKVLSGISIGVAGLTILILIGKI